MKKRPVDCIFCGEKQVLSAEEDVIPKWLAEKLARSARSAHGNDSVEPRFVDFSYGSTEDLLADARDNKMGTRATDKKVHGARPTAYKLRSVCKVCNGGWMSNLEEAAKKIIPGLLRGKSKFLDPYDQLILSTWIVKTCIVFDAYQKDPMIPTEMGSRRFFELGYPLPGCQVAIGHDESHKPQGEMRRDRRRITDMPSVRSLPGDQIDSILITFQFDKLIVWSLINLFEDYQAQHVAGAMPIGSPRYVQIWPRHAPDKRIWWPNDVARASRTPTFAAEEFVPNAASNASPPFDDVVT